MKAFHLIYNVYGLGDINVRVMADTKGEALDIGQIALENFLKITFKSIEEETDAVFWNHRHEYSDHIIIPEKK